MPIKNQQMNGGKQMSSFPFLSATNYSSHKVCVCECVTHFNFPIFVAKVATDKISTEPKT